MTKNIYQQHNNKRQEKKTLKMDPSYELSYRQKKINPHKLLKKLERKYKNYSLRDGWSYEELLFILDQECKYHKCDRDVVRQLFEQSATSENKACLHDIIYKYVENLETSKLCLMREDNQVRKVKQKLNGLKHHEHSYVYLRMVQISVHARFSATPALSYKIQPSNIPAVSVINSLNPVLNHQYTLQMQTNKFKIIFFESGVQIFQWEWPDCEEACQEGEYHRKVVGESLSFEVKLKYQPMNSHPEEASLQQQLLTKEQEKQTSQNAFIKLCNFQPFLESGALLEPPAPPSTFAFALTETLVECLPCLGSHVRNLYYFSLFLMVIQCLASSSSGMEFLDMCVMFWMTGKLYEQEDQDLGMELWIVLVSSAVLVVKSIWTATKQEDNPVLVFIILGIVGKVINIFFVWISAIRKHQIPRQRKQLFYDGVDPKLNAKPKPMEESLDNQTIWM